VITLFGPVALHRKGAPQLEMCQRADGLVEDDASMIEDFLELCRGLATFVRGQVGFSSHVDRIKVGPVAKPRSRRTKLKRSSDLQINERLLRVCMA
jgi:hypothetical protein